MRFSTSLFITAILLCHPLVFPQQLTSQFPVSATAAPAAEQVQQDLPPAPDYPIAQVVPATPTGVPVRFEYKQMEKHGSIYTLTGAVRIDYKSYTLWADKVSFDQETSDAEADGHVRLQGSRNNELILADHGKLNFDLETGRFDNVTGSVGRAPSESKKKLLYTTSNPFLFSGRYLIKEGPERYEVVQGTMTSCLLPDPDWRIHAAEIRVNYGEAHAKSSYFTLFGVPILYLPYITHPVTAETRSTGFLIPNFETTSTKGTVIGETFYLVLNRSMDLTFGTQYFSKRGWSPSGNFRYRGRGEDFISARFTALWDRGLAPSYINQGGQDILFSGRRDFDTEGHNRVVATGEYLSSYVYREAFAESFALAIASQVKSTAFLTHNDGGFSASIQADRYQNFLGITQVGNTYDTPQIRILHLPTLQVDSFERRAGSSPLAWSFFGSAGGATRSEPEYTSGAVGRFDLNPHLALPIHVDGWTLRPEVGARETFYTRGQIETSATPLPTNGSVSRADLEASFELRPPALVRDFKAPLMEKLFAADLRHTIEPELRYRFVGGVNNFFSVPKFDPIDVVSNTNEMEMSITQRLLLRHLQAKPCTIVPLPEPDNGIIYVPWAYTECGGNTDAWLTWKLAAKYFFDPYFGGATQALRRNVLATGLDLTGVSFLNGPRNTSPVISRLKLRTSQHTDLEWDADYDFKSKRLDASNIFADYRQENIFTSLGYSTLQALNANFNPALGSQVTKYNLLRLLVGYGAPTKRGLSVAANAGYDLTQDALQYGGIETSYNLDCCGLAVEYRRLALGSVRNENLYSFNFTLAGIGAAGNLTHAERIF